MKDEMTKIARIEVWRVGNTDLDRVVPLFDAYRRFYEKASDPDAARDFLAARLAAGESVIFLAGDGERALGFIQLYPAYSSTRMARLWLLNDLFVTAEARGRGVGEALLKRARQHAEETGACELVLETANDNPARRLYERSGYRHVTDLAFYKLAL